MRSWWWLPATALALAMLATGLHAGQWGAVKGWAEMLCTGCVGLYR